MSRVNSHPLSRRLVQSVGPASEVLDLSTTKSRLRIVGEDDDADLTAWIQDAREWAEKYTARALIKQTFIYYLDAFSRIILLPKPPLMAVLFVMYVDLDGTVKNVSPTDYMVDSVGNDVARLTTAPEQVWPATQRVFGAVNITYDVGYGTTAATVPSQIKEAMLLYIGERYDKREMSLPGAVFEPPLRAYDMLRNFQQVAAL